MTLPVPAALSIDSGVSLVPPEALDATITCERAGANIEIRILLESGTRWTLTLDPARASYVAGTLAVLSGVELNEGSSG